MTPGVTFALHATDGAARTGELIMPRGTIRTPAFMPVGTAGTVKAMYPGPGAGARRRHHPRQHLSPDAPARRRAGGGARRPPRLRQLAVADPDRFRRLPGDVARLAPEASTRTASPSARISTAPSIA